MVTDLITQDLIQFIKIVGIIFSLIHLLAGFILVRQIFRMNQIVKTRNAGCFSIVGLIYLFVLGFILLLVILI